MLRPQVITAGSHGASARFTLFGGYRAGLLQSCHRAGGSLLRRARPAPQGGRVVGGRKVGRGCGGAVCCASPDEVRTAVARTAAESPTKVKAVVTVKLTVGGMLTNVALSRGLDDFTDLLGKSLYIELVSAELDPGTGAERKAVGSFVHKAKREGDTQKYEGEVTVPKGFGEIGALLLTNEHHKEMFLQDVVLISGDGDDDPLTFSCHSWVHAKSDDPRKRVFFSDKAYLPSQTPSGLQRLREEELQTLRGDGQGERKKFERVYDYDVYNDLGQPDSSEDQARPVLGGHQHPYPRRCRTGRPSTKKDPHSEKRSNSVYVPRDESFSEVKGMTFSAKTVRSVVHALLPSLETAIVDPKLGFPLFTSIDTLFNEGLDLPPQQQKGFFQSVLPRLVKAVSEGKNNVLLFETPALLERDKFSWFRDEEFSRQALAGVNPFSIQLVTLPLPAKIAALASVGRKEGEIGEEAGGSFAEEGRRSPRRDRREGEKIAAKGRSAKGVCSAGVSPWRGFAAEGRSRRGDQRAANHSASPARDHPDFYQSCYVETIKPISNQDKPLVDFENVEVKPPTTKRRAGRPKKNRIPSQQGLEVKMTYTCSRCKQKGHNRKSCSNPIFE